MYGKNYTTIQSLVKKILQQYTKYDFISQKLE